MDNYGNELVIPRIIFRRGSNINNEGKKWLNVEDAMRKDLIL